MSKETHLIHRGLTSGPPSELRDRFRSASLFSSCSWRSPATPIQTILFLFNMLFLRTG